MPSMADRTVCVAAPASPAAASAAPVPPPRRRRAERPLELDALRVVTLLGLLPLAASAVGLAVRGRRGPAARAGRPALAPVEPGGLPVAGALAGAGRGLRAAGRAGDPPGPPEPPGAPPRRVPVLGALPRAGVPGGGDRAGARARRGAGLHPGRRLEPVGPRRGALLPERQGPRPRLQGPRAPRPGRPAAPLLPALPRQPQRPAVRLPPAVGRALPAGPAAPAGPRRRRLLGRRAGPLRRGGHRRPPDHPVQQEAPTAGPGPPPA